MIPQSIIDYLDGRAVAYRRRLHRRAITAQELAATVHVPGRQVAKSVLVKADGKVFIAVLPATEMLDEDQVAIALDASSVRLLRESEFERFFPDCEPGAEPPFGGLYGLPLVIDSSLAEAESIIVRAGSHEEAIEMQYEDLYRLEGEPRVAPISRTCTEVSPVQRRWHEGWAG